MQEVFVIIMICHNHREISITNQFIHKHVHLTCSAHLFFFEKVHILLMHTYLFDLDALGSYKHWGLQKHN